jgi:hypothetical protein
MLKKKASRKGLSDYQSEFCINVPTRIVLSGSVGSGDSNYSRFLSYATVEKMKLRLLNSNFRKSCVPLGSFASVKSLYWAGKDFLHVCSIGRCGHVFGLLARFT